MTAYGIIWLEQAVPSFTAYGGALMPFIMGSGQQRPFLNTTWTTTTTMYKTTLACQPALVSNSTSGVSYSNGKGCVAELGLPATNDPTALYIGWYMDQHISYALSQMGCPSENFSHTFLAYFSDGLTSTALFCEPSYWTQQVNATLMATDRTILEIMPLGTPEPLADTLFNISNFEYILGTGAAVKSQRADISKTSSAIFQRTRLQDMLITGNLTDGNMVGYAFGMTRLAPSDYLNPTTLASSFEKAHQLLFSLAVGTLLSTSSHGPDQRRGSIQSPANTIFIVRTLALLVESFLGLVTILTIALLYKSRVRPSQLRYDPACLNDMVGMIDPDSPTPTVVEDTLTGNEVLHASIEHGKFRFRALQPANKHQISRECSGNPSEISLVQVPDIELPLIRPLELRLIVAAVFIAILLLAVITLIILHFKARDDLGMPQPSNNTVANQLLTNYLPVIFATFLEPFWLLLNRVLCILRPFEELRTGNAQPSKSLKLKYTSLPPQLVIFRALRARHFLLAAICAIGLSANILSVALSGLFQTSVTTVGADSTFKPLDLPIFEQIPTFDDMDLPNADPLYVVKANVSDGTALPPWLSQDRFFMPFVTGFSSLNLSTKAVKAVTQGFGAKLACAAIDYDAFPFINGSGEYGIGRSAAPVVVPQAFTGGRDIICNNSNQGPDGGQNNSKAALEVIIPLSAVDQSTAEFCATLLLVGFLRANLSVSSDNYKTDNSDQPADIEPNVLAVNSLSSLWMVCQPTFLTAPYSVTVDNSGRIQEYTQVGSYASNSDPFFSGNATVDNLFNRTGYLWGHIPDTHSYWHNDTFVDTWFAFFIKQLTNVTVFIDPTQPVPTFDVIVPVVEDVYARVFAIILSLNTDWFGNPPPDARIAGTVFTAQSRIFLSRPAYIIIMTLLGLNILVATVYYAKRPKRMLRRMPTTIASVLELFDGSGLVKEANNGGGLKEDWKLGYGRFMGTDGKPRIGIERRPFVISWGDGPQ